MLPHCEKLASGVGHLWDWNRFSLLILQELFTWDNLFVCTAQEYYLRKVFWMVVVVFELVLVTQEASNTTSSRGPNDAPHLGRTPHRREEIFFWPLTNLITNETQFALSLGFRNLKLIRIWFQNWGRNTPHENKIEVNNELTNVKSASNHNIIPVWSIQPKLLIKAMNKFPKKLPNRVPFARLQEYTRIMQRLHKEKEKLFTHKWYKNTVKYLVFLWPTK